MQMEMICTNGYSHNLNPTIRVFYRKTESCYVYVAHSVLWLNNCKLGVFKPNFYEKDSIIHGINCWINNN